VINVQLQWAGGAGGAWMGLAQGAEVEFARTLLLVFQPSRALPMIYMTAAYFDLFEQC
jgi:hypothetical protein